MSLLALLLLPAACGRWSGAGPGCTTIEPLAALPESVQEASGVAVSRTHSGVFWVVNDSGDRTLHAVNAAGASLGTVPVGGMRHRDWEDLALAECASGDCLYIADVGDNYAERDTVFVYRMPEPEPGRADSVAVDVFSFRYPDGPRDTEAMFVLPGERLYFVNKGTDEAVFLYRYPGELRSDTVKTLVEVQALSTSSRLLPRQVTGAAATVDGERVVVRTYETLGFYRMEADTLRLLEDGTVNLRTLQEGQGEGVALGADGTAVLVSEAGPTGRRGSIAVLRCEPGQGG